MTLELLLDGSGSKIQRDDPYFNTRGFGLKEFYLSRFERKCRGRLWECGKLR